MSAPAEHRRVAKPDSPGILAEYGRRRRKSRRSLLLSRIPFMRRRAGALSFAIIGHEGKDVSAMRREGLALPRRACSPRTRPRLDDVEPPILASVEAKSR